MPDQAFLMWFRSLKLFNLIDLIWLLVIIYTTLHNGQNALDMIGRRIAEKASPTTCGIYLRESIFFAKIDNN